MYNMLVFLLYIFTKMPHSPTYISIHLLLIVTQNAVYRFSVVALVFILHFTKEVSQRKPHILYLATFVFFFL